MIKLKIPGDKRTRPLLRLGPAGARGPLAAPPRRPVDRVRPSPSARMSILRQSTSPVSDNYCVFPSTPQPFPYLQREKEQLARCTKRLVRCDKYSRDRPQLQPQQLNLSLKCGRIRKMATRRNTGRFICMNGSWIRSSRTSWILTFKSVFEQSTHGKLRKQQK